MIDELDEFIVEKVEKSDKIKIFELKEQIKRLEKEKNINWKNKFNTLCNELEQRPIEEITDKKKQELMFTFGIRAVADGKYGEGFFDYYA